jgi:hypothetical protein
VRLANCARIQLLIAGRHAGKNEDYVLGVGCREWDAGSVVSGVGKLRSKRESRDCRDGMMIYRSDGRVQRRVREFGFQRLESVLAWMLESNSR